MNARHFRKGRQALGVSILLTVLWAGPGTPPAAGNDATQRTPEVADIPPGGLARNFTLVGHNPLLDSNQGTSSFNQYFDPPLGIPRGSNGDITAAGDCVYVGSLVGLQPALIVDVSNPAQPTVVGAVPDLVVGVGNGIEGIEASDDLLVIDQRRALGGFSWPVAAGLPARGIAIYDIGKNGATCRTPRLVARFEYRSATGEIGKDTHTISLWRDPVDPRRVLGVQSFTDEEPVDNTAIQVVDLTGCPQVCSPRVVAKWSARTEHGPDRWGSLRAHTHEAIMSTDGNRVYVSQWQDGFFMLNSSKLVRTLRGQDTCDPNQPTAPGAPDHCLKSLNATYDARAAAFPIGWSHSPLRVPDRPYLLELSESPGPLVARDTSGRVIEPPRIASTCPGSFTRMIYIGEDAYFAVGNFDAQGERIPGFSLRGDLYPTPFSNYATEEQKLENCGADGFKPGTAPLTNAWFSPHQALVFPNLAVLTYYTAGLRAIDISNPFVIREVGHFINAPVPSVRWASYGVAGNWWAQGEVPRVPTVGPPMVFAFSSVISHRGYIIYSDVHSGLYVLRYTGPRSAEVPQVGICLTGNPGAIAPGYDPCPPFGKWDGPANAWTKAGVP